MDLLVDGSSGGSVASYSFTNVTANHTIAASFTIDTYTITASAGANGGISPSGPVSVNHGANQIGTATRRGKYQVSEGPVSFKKKGQVASYTFNSVKENRTIA